MNRTVISTEKAPAAVGPYSQAVRTGNLIFTAGQVALVPGTEFGSPGHVRFSYAVAQETLEDAVSRIAKAAAQLS